MFLSVYGASYPTIAQRALNAFKGHIEICLRERSKSLHLPLSWKPNIVEWMPWFLLIRTLQPCTWAGERRFFLFIYNGLQTAFGPNLPYSKFGTILQLSFFNWPCRIINNEYNWILLFSTVNRRFLLARFVSFQIRTYFELLLIGFLDMYFPK